MIIKGTFAKTLSLLTAATIVLVLSASAFAQGNIHFGRFNLITGLRYDGDYNDNIFRDPDNEESDYIHTITPSIELVYPGKSPGNYFKASYNVGIARYSDFTDNDYENHKVFAGLGYRAAAGFYIKADDFYQDTADPYGSENFYAEGRRTERWNNTLNMTLGYDFADVFTVEAFAGHFIENYKLREDQFQDRNRMLLGGTFLYRWSEKVQFLAEVGRSGVTYNEQNDGIDGWNEDNSQDNVMTDGLLGVRFLPSGKLVGDLKLGASAISYENDADKNGNVYNDDTIPTFDLELSYFLSERTSFNAFAGRNRRSSATANRANDVSASYIDTFLGLGFSQGFLNKLRFDIEFSRRMEDYQNVSAGSAEKRLIRYMLAADLNWDIKHWLDAGLTFDYIDKSATEDEYASDEYKVTQYGFYVSLTY